MYRVLIWDASCSMHNCTHLSQIQEGVNHSLQIFFLLHMRHAYLHWYICKYLHCYYEYLIIT